MSLVHGTRLLLVASKPPDVWLERVASDHAHALIGTGAVHHHGDTHLGRPAMHACMPHLFQEVHGFLGRGICGLQPLLQLLDVLRAGTCMHAGRSAIGLVPLAQVRACRTVLSSMKSCSRARPVASKVRTVARACLACAQPPAPR